MAPNVISPQAAALLRVIRHAEGTAGPKGYSTMFGGGQFDPSKGHPDRVVKSGGYSSAAAGAYQFMPDTWRGVSSKLKLPDFSPGSQDLGALQLIRARGVNPDQPLTPQSLNKLAPEWASLPTLKGTSYYGQPVKAVKELLNIYQQNLNPDPSSVPKKPQQLSQAPDTLRQVSAGNLFGGMTMESLMKQGIQEELLTNLIQPEEDKTNLFAQLLNQTRPYYS